MAHLPPKVPNMTPNWTDHQFPHQRMASIEHLASTVAATTAAQNLLWVDEFHDFSTAKRGCHRRSISDSIAFVETPMVEECRRPAAMGSRTHTKFDRFDDEQLVMSMFADEIAGTVAPTMSLSTSTPSDHNSNNEDDHKQAVPLDRRQLKNEPEEVQSSCKSEAQQAAENSTDKIFDPKRVKRILANRQSAQRSRVRKLQYISELERSVNSLQAEVSVLSPRVAFLDHQRLILNVDNSALKQRIAALAQDKIFKDAHQEALRREIERLRNIYREQNLKKMENAVPPLPSKLLSSSDANGSIDNEEELLN